VRSRLSPRTLQALVLSALVLVTINCGRLQKNHTAVNANLNANSAKAARVAEFGKNFDRREQMYQELLEAVNELAVRAPTETSRGVSGFYRKGTVMGVPTLTSGKAGVMVVGQLGERIPVVPMLDDTDTSLDDDEGVWHKIMKSGDPVQLQMNRGFIVLREKPAMSKLGRALYAFHYGYHVIQLKAGAIDAQTTKPEGCVGEMMALEEQFKIMDKIGGDRYRAALRREVKYFKMSGDLTSFLPPQRDYNPELANILAQPESEAEKEMWARYFYANALFSWVDSLGKSRMQRYIRKTRVICLLADQTGLLEEGLAQPKLIPNDY